MKLHLEATPQAGGDGKTIVFIANSGTVMRANGLTVDLATLQAPLIGGQLKPVVELTAGDELSLPLLTDHEATVTKQAGTITRLEVTGQGLIATARLADTEPGQAVQQLAASGALRNSFSIGIEYAPENLNPETGLIAAAELTEISVVWSGADPKTRLIDQYSRPLGEAMTSNESNEFALTASEAAALEERLTETIRQQVEAAIMEVTDSDTAEPEEAEETPAAPEQASAARTAGPQNVFITQPRAQATYARPVNGWLSSQQAVAEFERTLLDQAGRGVDNFKKAWSEVARHKLGFASSISDDDVQALIPTPVAEVISDVYNTADPLWPYLNKLGMDQFTAVFNETDLLADSSAGMARPYLAENYGEQKQDQTIKLAKRTLTADYLYKRVTLNKGDIRKTQRPGALVNYVVRELGNRIFQTIGLAVVFNDTLSGVSGFDQFISVTKDAENGDGYANTLTEGTYRNLLFDFRMAAAMVKAPGDKILVASSELVAELGIVSNDSGTPILPLTQDQLASALGVSAIVTPTWFKYTRDEDSVLGVVLSPSRYGVVGDTTVEAFTDFSLDTNESVFLQELFVGGGLMEPDSATVVKAGAGS